MTHRLLPKPFYATFDTEIEAKNYGEQLTALLTRGIVPQELLSVPKAVDDPLLTQLAGQYEVLSTAISPSDRELLRFTLTDKPVVGLRLSALTYRWVESYVAWLKSPEKHITPSSIRKRIGVLARVVDWHIKRTTADNATPLTNVLRLLPKGYSNYVGAVAEAPVRRDQSRDRRLSAEESARIEKTLAGWKRDDRERAYPEDPVFALLYRLIVGTGMRLFEAYRLRVDCVDLEKNVLRVEGSKGHRGEAKPRMVPIVKELRGVLREWCKDRVGFVFPYWDGTPGTQRGVTNRLSGRFRTLFEYAQVPEFTEHDLRHEAACRWFELRDTRGWVFSDIEVCRIMGWKDPRMALRYASLRGEDLSARLG